MPFDHQTIALYNLPMRRWSIELTQNRSFTLCADSRLCETDYFNDHIWELSITNGEFEILSLQTTFGLRAHNFRLFPRFIENNEEFSNPRLFIKPPTIRCFYPNFIEVTCSPIEDIDVILEYWVPCSHAVAGRLSFRNRGLTARKIRFEWVAQLMPLEDEDQPMAPSEIQATQVLSGSSGGLCPVVFLNSGPVAVSGPYPALILVLDLPPETSRTVIWSQAALASMQDSFQLARSIALKNWDAERTRIEHTNAGQLEIYTGESEWDLAFALSQNIAFSLFLGATEHLPCPSMVINRTPEQGYSRLGDGSDYDRFWSGQTPLEAYYLASLVLPCGVDLIQGVLENFLMTQQDHGFIDWKPGLGGQRSHHLATPLLANLAWRIYQINQNQGFIAQVFPSLLSFLQAWFSPEHDRDGDGFPEWEHLMQTGFDDHPIFAQWHPQAQGADIATIESPALCSFLYKECQIMIRMARLIGRIEDLSTLERLANKLRQAVETTWNQEHGGYYYRDRDLHTTIIGERIGEIFGSGIVDIHKRLEKPVRLVIRILTSGEATRRVQLFIHGTSSSGKHKIERLSSEKFQWFFGIGTTTSEQTYKELEHIEVAGLTPQDQVIIESINLSFRDLSLMLPLWAGIPSKERAMHLLHSVMVAPNGFLKTYGLTTFPDNRIDLGNDVYSSINMPLNSMIGDGLIYYGFIEEAKELTTRLMSAITKNLMKEGQFRRYYHAESATGIGERGSLLGLAPLGLFLNLLGIRIFTPFKVAVFGKNPFPWTVTIKYRGLNIQCKQNETSLTFPNGQTIHITDSKPCLVTLP